MDIDRILLRIEALEAALKIVRQEAEHMKTNDLLDRMMLENDVQLFLGYAQALHRACEPFKKK